MEEENLGSDRPPNSPLRTLMTILVIIIILFGVGGIGKLASEMGAGIKAFREGIRDDDEKEENK